jgi:hypothetical protein
MKKSLQAICLFLLLFIIGCATVPSLRVSQPWIRSLKSNQLIEPTKNIKVEVAGITSPLLGSEQLTSDKLKLYLTRLIKRRGFLIDNTTYDYLMKLSYRTDRNDKIKYSSSISSTNAQAYVISTGSGAGATSGLGVSIARAVGAIVSSSRTMGTQTAEQTLSYIHTISMELSNREGVLLWKGESTWDSEELNLMNGIIPALQLILSDLPTDKTVRPEIPEVKETHVKNYYRLECKDAWFTCPALPYRILFSDKNSRYTLDVSIPSEIKNQNAFAAYVDLVQTAEYALPKGNTDDWSDPLKLSLWENVTLGGQYFLGPQKTPVNILIKLTGKSDGYYIAECKIATDKEYSDFNNNLTTWRQILKNYYDVYER